MPSKAQLLIQAAQEPKLFDAEGHALSPVPQRATADSAGLDLKAWIHEPQRIAPGQWHKIFCGFRMALPSGFEAQIRPRSGLAAKFGITLLNSPGTIDADYRGDVSVLLINHGKNDFVVEPGMRVAQMVISTLAQMDIKLTNELSESLRGEGGFGSTGIK